MIKKVFLPCLSVVLCFCMICSICGVSFAVSSGEEEETVRDPWLDAFEAWSPDPETYVSDVPVLSEPSQEPVDEPLPSPEPTPIPEPTSSPEPSDEPSYVPRPSEVGIGPDDWNMPGGDALAIDPSSFSSDNTYIMLPDDFVITSASNLDDTYAIDPQVLSPVTPSNTSGLKSVLLSILGNYDPIVAQYQYSNANGTYSYIREIQPDYVWLVSAAIFAILLYCTWRLLGGLICQQ